MLIAIVDFHVAPDARQTALAVLVHEIPTVTARADCLTFRPYCDPQSATHVGVLHEWKTETGFAGYLGSAGFKTVGETLSPMMQGPPSSRRYRAQLIETVA